MVRCNSYTGDSPVISPILLVHLNRSFTGEMVKLFHRFTQGFTSKEFPTLYLGRSMVLGSIMVVVVARIAVGIRRLVAPYDRGRSWSGAEKQWLTQWLLDILTQWMAKRVKISDLSKNPIFYRTPSMFYNGHLKFQTSVSLINILYGLCNLAYIACEMDYMCPL